MAGFLYVDAVADAAHPSAMKHLLTILCTITALLLGAAEARSADLEKGWDAYERGDYAAALQEFRPLAEQGDDIAQFSLGQMYYEGQGVARDYVQAVEWYRKAAEQGYARAQYNFGLKYHKGEGKTQDYLQAAAWFRKAARQEYAAAQLIFGLMH